MTATKLTGAAVLRHLIEVCFHAFAVRDDVKVSTISKDEFKVLPNGHDKEDAYYVWLGVVEYDEEYEETNGFRLFKKDYKERPPVVKDHVHILDVCLWAWANDPVCRGEIRNMTTDGDHHDCEAIFDLRQYSDRVVKVRSHPSSQSCC